MSRLKDGYVSQEFTINLLFSLFVISLLFSVEGIFRVVDLLVKRTFAATELVELFLVVYAAALPYVIPLTLLSGATALFMRLSVDRELLVLASCGINPATLLRRPAVIACAAVAAMLWFNFEVLPAVRHEKRRLVRGLRYDDPLSLLTPGSLVQEIPGVTILVEKVEEHPAMRTLTRLSLSYLDSEGRVTYVQAASGAAAYDAVTNSMHFSLERGVLIVMPPTGSTTIRVVRFAAYDFLLPLPSWYRTEGPPRISEMSVGQIRRSGTGLEGAVEIHRRAVLACTPLVFLWLGAGIGARLRIRSRNAHLGVGIFTGVLFFQLMLVGEIISGKTGTPVAMWLPVAVCAAIGWYVWR